MSLHSDVQLSDKIQNQWFEPDYWQKQSRIVGESKGRHITWFIQPSEDIDSKAWVLRHYYRGGWMAKLTHDQFLFTGVAYTRPFRELSLLADMRQLGLPVPQAKAARIIQSGIFYRADLLMEKIEASDLVAILSKKNLSDDLWRKLGEVIAKFHLNGIYHADLNAHNILIGSSDKIWLIDFDRCEKRSKDSVWQMQNIDRLKRSFAKEKKLLPTFYFAEQSWQNLLDGYQSAMNKD